MVGAYANSTLSVDFTPPQPPNDAQLCFNKVHFNRKDFSVERFLNLARRRVTLDVIHNDLRTYLRSLQNSMIELINDDYADFVNLSSSLATLKDSIEKISFGINSSWDSFSTSTADIRTAAQLVEQKCGEFMSNRSAQILTRNKISLLLAIDRLSRSLEKRSAALSLWLPKLISLVVEVEIWFGRLPEQKIPSKAINRRQTCYSRIKKILIEELIADMCSNFNNISNILQLLALIGKDDVAVFKVADSVVVSQISLTNTIEKDVLLSSLFENILLLRKKWINIMEKQLQLNSKTEFFIDIVLLRYSIVFLDEKFGSVFVPSDTQLFHKCYTISTKFVLEWPSLSKFCEVRTMLKTILGKFNTLVYFKMQTQQFQLDMKAQSKPSEFVFNNLNNLQFDCRCPLSITSLNAISTLFKDNDIFLPSLIDRFWDFTLKVLASYVDWAKEVNVHFAAADIKVAEDADKAWLNLVVLSCDITMFSNQFCRLSEEVIWQRLRDLNFIDFEPLKECILIFTNEISMLKSKIIESIVALLSAKSVQELSGVADIPKQYRWTKKPFPSICSAYLPTTFAICEIFLTESLRIGYTSEESENILGRIVHQLIQVFCDQAEQVLDSVEQMGSSLKRFQRKQQQRMETGTTAPDADTDETKIRAQVVYDVDFMIQRAIERKIETTRLLAIQLRAKSELS